MREPAIASSLAAVRRARDGAAEAANSMTAVNRGLISRSRMVSSLAVAPGDPGRPARRAYRARRLAGVSYGVVRASTVAVVATKTPSMQIGRISGLETRSGPTRLQIHLGNPVVQEQSQQDQHAAGEGRDLAKGIGKQGIDVVPAGEEHGHRRQYRQQGDDVA